MESLMPIKFIHMTVSSQLIPKFADYGKFVINLKV